ncbi:GIP [Symbiodinium microadriaticum]|nr:GIP [Symbiodinium microadriaticum]
MVPDESLDAFLSGTNEARLSPGKPEAGVVLCAAAEIITTGAGREQAESEAATNDVTVDPETLDPLGYTILLQTAVLRKFKDMGEALGNRRDGSDGLWSASKGPKPGVKYRGGTPPAPPQWTYAREDVRAFDRYERKVRMWERQVQAFMPKREAAMALYVSLRGEAEEELEFMAFDEIDCEHGLENILAALRRPLQTREVYLKRRYLHEYEYIGRQANESIRSFCNRYQRTEKSLLATGINVAAMYDGESRGSRLLDRMRLTMEQQRLILVSTGQSLQFDAIRDAAQLQYPEHRPVPAVAYNREFENNHRTPDHRDHPKGGKSGRDSGKGSKGPKGGKGPRQPYRTYVTEEASAADYDEDPAETLADIPEDEAEHDQDEDEELIPDDSVDPEDGDDIQTVMKEVADCLTVTARRLQGVTLGRKFTTNPKNKDLEQRKRNSHCAACGQKGHWQGDDACPVSAKGAKGAGKSSHGNSAKGDSSKKGGAPKKVLNVSFHGSPDTEPTFEPEPPTAEELQEYGSYFTTFMTTFAGPSQDVFLSKPGDFAGFAVLDTACQRSLCSEKWLVKHRELLAQHKLDVKSAPESEGFQFGTGPIQVSKRHVFFPVCLDGSLETCALFGASVMEYPSDIPLLLSLGMLSKKLKAILDLPRNVAYLGVFNVEVPIIKINGHVCIELNRLPKGHFAKWKAMSSILDQGEPDSELLTPSPLPATTANACAAAATGMASGMAPRRQVHLGGGTSPSSLPEPDGAPRPSQAVLAVAPGPHAPALDGQYDKGAAGPVRAPCSHAGQEREPPRKLPKVLPVQHPVEVGSFRVGRAAIFAIAAAVTTLGQLWGQDTLGGQASARTGGPGGHGNMLGQPIGAELATLDLEHGAPRVNARMTIDSGGLQMMEDQYQEGMQAKAAASSKARARPARAPIPEHEGRTLKAGHQTWLVSELRKAGNTYAREVEMSERVPTYKDIYKHPKIDLLEVTSNETTVTNEAATYGLTALEPFSKTDENATADLHDMIAKFVPTFVVCHGTYDSTSKVHETRARACLEQEHQGRYFLFELKQGGLTTTTAAEYTKDLLDHKNVTTFECDLGAYGLEDEDGLPSSSRSLWARRCYPSRFQQKPVDVLYARPINDTLAWKEALEELESRFVNTHKKPFNLNATDPLRVTLEQLVPWRIERVQAAWTPQSRRFPQDIAFTHRGAALKLSTGELVLESEDMAQITYPKQRFARPVRVGLFFFGFPKETPETAAAAEQPGEQQATSSTRPLHGFETELWFEDPPREVDKKLQYSIARLHVNMGHPPKAELIRLMAASGNLTRKVLLALDSLRCGSCIRLQKPRPPPVSSVAPAFTGYFGEVLQADLVYIRTINGVAVPVLGMVCEATNYHAAKALTSRNPAELLQTIIEIWYRPLGLPLHFKCDAGGEFAAELAAWHGRSGVLHEVIPAEAHFRLGKIERRNSLMRSLTERIIDERGIYNIEELNKALPAVTFSMNSCTYSYGRSPFQAVFGRVPRPIGDLSSDPRSLVTSPNEGDKRLMPELLRADALRALAEFSASTAVRRALLRKTRHQDPAEFQPGQPLAYWRWTGRARQHKRGAWSLGRFLSLDPDRKSLWLQVGTSTVKVAANQVRQACGWEEWTPSAEDIKILKDAEHNLRDALWEDHTEEPPGNLEEPHREDGVTRVHVIPRSELYVPQPHECEFDIYDLSDQRRTYRNDADEQPADDNWRDPLCDQSFEPPWSRTPNPRRETSAKKVEDVSDSVQYQSPEFSALPETPLSPPAPGTPDWTALPPQQPPPGGTTSEAAPGASLPSEGTNTGAVNDNALVNETHNELTNVNTTQGSASEPSLPQVLPPPVQSEASQQADTGGNLLPQKRTAAVLVSTFPLHYDFHDNGEVTLRECSETKDNRRPFQRNYYCKCYLSSTTRKEELEKAGVSVEPEREDDSTDDEKLSSSNDRTRSRQEAKQLDREIPWRQLTELPRSQYEEYLQATRVENDNWMMWGGIRPISHREAKKICDTPRLARRILAPPTGTSPREWALYAPSANKDLGNTGKRWHLRTRQLRTQWSLAPRDPLIEETCSFPAALYEITGNCYGLPNAPRVWYQKVHRSMTGKGFVRHTYDRCLYYFQDPRTNELQAVVIIHVDDFLATYSDSFPIKILEELFTWGSVNKVTTETGATYRGKEITLKKFGTRFKYIVTQREFIEGMDGGRLPRGRAQREETLTSEEWSDFRSIAGSLQWLAGQCRPEIGPVVSLSNRGKDTTYKDLQRLFEAVAYLKETSDRGLVYQDLALNDETVFVTYTDSSFANAELKSQFGVCVFLSNKEVVKRPTPGTLVDWRSARSTRICRSTLAAEASAADEGADRAVFANICLSEIFTGEPSVKGLAQFDNLQVTDAKSLYDTVVAENPSVSDKRSLINIRSVQQSVRPKDFRWVPTVHMIADGLTKLDWKLTEEFSKTLQNPVLTLTQQVPKENFTSVKSQT